MEQGFFGDSEMVHGYIADQVETNFTTTIKHMMFEYDEGFDDSLPINWTREKMILLPKEELILMGQNGRKRAVEVFDEKIIINHYKDIIYRFK